MEPALFDGMDVEREETGRYGRFRALKKSDLEDLDEEDTARTVVDTIEEELDQRLEERLVRAGHISQEQELPPQKFQEIHKRIENIENEWEAAFKGKEYSEVEETDVKVLQNLLSKFLDSLKYELKVTAYIESFHSEMTDLEIDRGTVETLVGLEESEGSEVGKHLENLNKRQRQDLEKVRKKVNRKLQERQEEFEDQIEQFDNQIEMYREHLQTVEAVEKELEEIAEKTDKEDVEEHSEEVQELSRQCMEIILDLVEQKEKVVEEHTKARKLKKNVNKLFLSGIN